VNMAKTTRKRSRSATIKKPCVLVIDDERADGEAALILLGSGVMSVYREPSEVTNQDISRANLILVDFKLENWPDRDDLDTPSLKPRHGIALAANLRSNLSLSQSRSPTAFALRSGKLNELSGKLSPLNREHSIARMLDMEWVFSKSETERFPSAVRSLAKAVQQLPHPWPSYKNSEAALLRLLKIDKKVEWSANAINDVRKANPPQDVMAETSNGMAILRWLLHEVLPYPSFLLDERYIAARLRVRPEVLRSILTSSKVSKIKTQLQPFAYAGLLHDFSGPRWWRAGIDNWLWHETAGDPLNPNALGALAQRMLPADVHMLSLKNPVVSLDDQFRPSDTLIELNSAVQLKPDDWPEIAEPAWVTLQDAKQNADVAARVIALDREKL
jgi:hypothetical protein